MKLANMQDVFLNQLRKNNIHVTVFLTNGFQLKGLVKSYDNFTVLLETDGRQQLIYKHAISTFVPARPIQLNHQQEAAKQEETK
ncbi:RNA chaperone Hfq [Planococcus lenghuensis]|uniref:RNA-binding protein Hfq n=1 Tax=Planococcus lenghuensis TaxID=2213202 RepID=A0A1Q2L0W4_9BACL|nr:RNA chaperone Hfq [Planococcus lenghuensis]AQQ53687.1 RNA chaperone Hfq [Planococcus lenghuensis]